jgi:hypothetical protein
MNRYFSLTSLLFIFVLPGMGQQQADSLSRADTLAGHEPVISSFTCTVSRNIVELQWMVNPQGRADYCMVERSTDGLSYQTIEVLKTADSASWYRLTDNPVPGEADYYRIKCNQAGKTIYSGVLKAPLNADPDFRFYPNPADKLLIIRTSRDINVQVLDERTTVRIQEDLVAGLRVINVSELEKGSYILKVTDKQSNRVSSTQLLKN